MEELTLNERDQRRLAALLDLDAGRMGLEDVASALERCPRHVRRMLRRLRIEGPPSVVHGNRGRAPAHTKPSTLRKRVVELYETKYVGFNFCQFVEMLREREKIFVSVSTVRRWLLAAGHKVPKPQKRPGRRGRRQRYPCVGMLIQMDASTEDWLEGRGDGRKLCLFLAIDDASSRAWAWFRYVEDAEGYIRVLRNIVRTAGIPLAVYVDKHSIFGQSKRFTKTETKFARSQFSRICEEAGIHLIHAHSPQAKGRVERDIQTFQDRLTSLLRLEKVDNVVDANRVLRSMVSDFNQRFTCAPAKDTPQWRPWPVAVPLDDVFCFKFRRTVAKDNTISFDSTVFDIPGDVSYAKQKVSFYQLLDGMLSIRSDGQVLATGRHQLRSLADTPAPPEIRVTEIKTIVLKRRLLDQSRQDGAPEKPSEARHEDGLTDKTLVLV